MTKISVEERRKIYERNPAKYAIMEMVATASEMEQAAKFIESLRAFHNKHNIFIKHTCECNERGVTVWNFIYLISEFKKYDIDNKVKDMWDDAYADTGLHARRDGYVTTGYPGKVSPCICPFSMK